jgi:hypothetical protein
MSWIIQWKQNGGHKKRESEIAVISDSVVLIIAGVVGGLAWALYGLLKAI